MASVQTIFSYLNSKEKIDYSKLSLKQSKVVKDIIKCRTKEAGLNRETCENCGNEQTHYNSCKNPACPKCQGINRSLWVDKQKYYSLNIPYFHVVFTLPDTLNSLCMLAPSFMYDLLFECASKTLIELSNDSKYLNAKIGFTCVLHTWGQNLSLHPHVHCIVTSGGVDLDNKWKSCKNDFLFPVKVVSKLFKGKYLSYLKERFIPKDKDEFQLIIDDAYLKDWVVYIKEPLNNPNSVIEYLGRYTHRIAISDGRIINHTESKVTFSYKDYKDGNKIKQMSLDETEFFSRFMRHVVPKGFCRIRHYGLLASANKTKRFIKIREITNTKAKDTPYVRDPVKILNKLFGRDIRICLCCGLPRHPLLE